VSSLCKQYHSEQLCSSRRPTATLSVRAIGIKASESEAELMPRNWIFPAVPSIAFWKAADRAGKLTIAAGLDGAAVGAACAAAKAQKGTSTETTKTDATPLEITRWSR
jgi:hypothetical protein